MTKFSEMGKRMMILVIIILILFCYLIYKLYNVQIQRHGELFDKARRKYTVVQTKEGKRGEIYDCYGHLLVGNIPCYDICADPSIAGTEAKCRVMLEGPDKSALERDAREIADLIEQEITAKA